MDINALIKDINPSFPFNQGTPALFLITLFFDSSMLATYVEDERWVLCRWYCFLVICLI